MASANYILKELNMNNYDQTIIKLARQVEERDASIVETNFELVRAKETIAGMDKLIASQERKLSGSYQMIGLLEEEISTLKDEIKVLT